MRRSLSRRQIIGAGAAGAVAGVAGCDAAPAGAQGGSSMYILPSGDSSGAKDTARVQAALEGSMHVAVLGPGSFYFSKAIALRYPGNWVIGQGEAATCCYVAEAMTGPALFAISARGCGLRDLSLLGTNSAVAGNPPVDGISVTDAGQVNVRNIFAQYLNGWILTGVHFSGGPELVRSRYDGITGYNCAGGVFFQGNRKTIGTLINNLEIGQIGVTSGSKADLDAFRLQDAFDVTGNNLNVGVGYGRGHGFHLIGSVANVWLATGDCGAYPAPTVGSGVCGVLVEDDSADQTRGSGSGIHFSGFVFQGWDVGVQVGGGYGGTASDVNFTDCAIHGNQSSGAVVTSAGGRIRFTHCEFGVGGSNGAGSPSAGAYDLDWPGAGSGTVDACEFASAIVPAGRPGVQRSVASSRQTPAFLFPVFSGVGSKPSNQFTSTPARLVAMP